MTRVKPTQSCPDQTGGSNSISGAEKNLLIVDDDPKFRDRLAKSMARRGFEVQTAAEVAEAVRLIGADPPDLALIDIRLQDGSGLEIIAELHNANPQATAIVLTGYGSIANAVAAVKAGASGYLSKLTEVDDIAAALLNPDALNRPSIPSKPMSDNRVRWEYLNRVFELCDRNLSKTARRLRTHRRSLQRLLKRRAPN